MFLLFFSAEDVFWVWLSIRFAILSSTWSALLLGRLNDDEGVEILLEEERGAELSDPASPLSTWVSRKLKSVSDATKCRRMESYCQRV